MKRIPRHLFTLCSALSLLLCAALCVLWVQSYSSGHQWSWSSGARIKPKFGGHVVDGSFELYVRHAPYPPPYDAGFHHGRANKEPLWSGLPWKVPGQQNWWGAGYRSEKLAPGLDVTLVWMPIYWLVGLTVLPPAVWMYQFSKRRHRTKRGLCPTCSYDLRASSGRCPECGTLASINAAS